MREPRGVESVITASDVREFFQQSLQSALDHQQTEADESTVVYIVNLLTTFTRSQELYDETPEGRMLRPLVAHYTDAVYAGSREERVHALRRLGDIALFVSGMFPDSLNRSLVDVDYYIAMGGTAYGHLSDTLPSTTRGRIYSRIFEELSAKFTVFVEALGEIADSAPMNNDRDVMRLYEVWMRTGSRRAARRLQRVGIPVSSGSLSSASH
jgi:hypothetical protein